MARTTKPAPTSRTVTRAATYCRISYDPSGLEAGVERQHVDTDRIADTHGWTVVERVVDNDRSASRYARKAREGWARLMAMVEAREVEALIAYDLDRLIRQPKELERLIDAAESGLSVVTATGSIDLTTGAGRMVARTLCNVAAMEADRVSERQRGKLRHDAQNGRAHWVRRPFGYTLASEVVHAEAKVVRDMYDWVIDGMSTTAVAVRLNSAGVKQASGAPWQSGGVKLFLVSPRNAGKRTYHGEVVGDAAWPPIVDMDTISAAAAAIAVRSQGARSGRRSMLTGLVLCGRCDGMMMYRTNASDKAAYRCMKSADLGTGCGQQIAAKYVDALVAEAVLERIGVIRAATVAPVTDVEAVDRLRAELASLADMVGKGTLSMAEWLAVREPLTARLAEAEAELTHTDAGNALARMAGDVSTLEDRWDDLDVDLQRRLISLVLDFVMIAPGSRGRLDLDRVTLIWKS